MNKKEMAVIPQKVTVISCQSAQSSSRSITVCNPKHWLMNSTAELESF